jgi:hypothetical protein
MARPYDVEDYCDTTKENARLLEEKIIELEYGVDSGLEPDSQRPTYLFRKREDSMCKVFI